MKRSRIALVVAIAVVLAVVVVAAVVANREDSSKCSTTGTNLITMFGKLSLPSGPTGSNFTLTLINGTCTPITGITVTSVEPLVAGVANTTFVVFNATLVSQSNPLPAGQLGTGSIPVSGINAGQKYDLLVTIEFSSGTASQVETMEIYPEA